MRSNLAIRFSAVMLILAVSTISLGQAAQRPPQSEPVKKTQPARPEPAGNKDQQDQAIKLEATLVTVPVIASDSDGRYIPDLRREDFSLHEDGVKQEIVFFATVNEPFHVVLMLDTSASTQEKLFGQIKRAATTFVEQLKPGDRMKVISFDDEVHDLCDFTNDRAELGRAVDKTRPGHGTKLYDAVSLALRALRSVEGRKAIVMFTDGVDMYSVRARYEDNIGAVEESGVIVYPIRYDTRAETEALLRSQSGTGGIIKRPPVGTTPPTVPGGEGVPQLPPIGPPKTDPRFPPIGSPSPPWTPGTGYPGGRTPDNRSPDNRYPSGNRYPTDVRIPDADNTDSRRYPRRDDSVTVELDAMYRLADRYLDDMAGKSGGKLMRADTLYLLPAAFAQIAAELRTQYALGYYPSNTARDSSYRKIKVSTKRNGAIIRARPGYRASAGN